MDDGHVNGIHVAGYGGGGVETDPQLDSALSDSEREVLGCVLGRFEGICL